MNRRFLTGLVVLFTSACLPATNATSFHATMNDDFRKQLQTAIEAKGADYRPARAILVETRRYGAELREAATTQDDWRARWMAQIALGWRENAPVFEQADTYIRGDFDVQRPLSGEVGVDYRVRHLVELGEAAKPRLAEVAWKTQEYDGRAQGAVFGTIVAFGDERFLPILRGLLDEQVPEAYRSAAILALGDLRDEASVYEVKHVMRDKSEPASVRVAALETYAEFELDETVEVLGGILDDETDPERLRVAAAERLLMREAPGTRDLFHEQIRDGADGLLLQTVVDGLLTVGDEASIPVLEELQTRTDDPELQALISEVVATLERR